MTDPLEPVKTGDPKPAPWLLFLTAAVLSWLVPLLLFLFTNSSLIGYDAYYHVQLTEKMLAMGPFLREFPWATETVWADAWFDKEWLFHLLLMPFVAWGQTIGAKLFVVLASLSAGAAFWYLCRVLGLSRRRACVAAAIMPWCCYGVFWMRLVVCRPHIVSIGITCLALALIIRRRPAALAVISLLYALSYTGHWQLLGWAVLYDLLYLTLDKQGRRRPQRQWKWPMFPAALLGMAVGEVIHPSFPANIHGLYVQNVLVLMNAWSGTKTATEPILELKAAGWDILWLTAPIFLGLAWVAWQCLRKRLQPDRIFWFLAVSTIGYLMLSILSFRFLEYFVPVAVAFLAAAARPDKSPTARADHRDRLLIGLTLILLTSFLAWGTQEFLYLLLIPLILLLGGLSWLPQDRLRFNPLSCLIGLWLLVFAAGGARHYFVRYVLVPGQTQNGHPYADAGAWIRNNLAPGDLVFSTRFGANSILWFHAPEQRFLVFLDPVFMRQRDPDRYLLWQQIRHGRHPEPVAAIRDLFGAHAVFLLNPPRQPGQQPNPESRLARQLKDGGARLVSANATTGAQVYELPAASN